MSTVASKLRNQIETALAPRIPFALTPHTRIERLTLPTGVAAIDALLGGGVAVGSITEIVGTISSGRTSCAQAVVAQIIQRGQVSAWVDVADNFDPESAAANCIDLDRLLWVRCGVTEQISVEAHVPNRKYASASISAQAPGKNVNLPQNNKAMKHSASCAPAPSRFKNKVGSPGMINRNIAQIDRTEQVAYDRLPARRGVAVLRNGAAYQNMVIPTNQKIPRSTEPESQNLSFTAAYAGAALTHTPQTATNRHSVEPGRSQNLKSWSRLDQALRVTDLLLQAGGFGVVVLDLGTITPEFVSRIPPSTWFRFRAAANRSRTLVVLLTQHPCAKTSADRVLHTAIQLPVQETVLTSLSYKLELGRQQFQSCACNEVTSLKKPSRRVVSAEWTACFRWR